MPSGGANPFGGGANPFGGGGAALPPGLSGFGKKK
jgi:signal recognition particle subunit SRP54